MSDEKLLKITGVGLVGLGKLRATSLSVRRRPPDAHTFVQLTPETGRKAPIAPVHRVRTSTGPRETKDRQMPDTAHATPVLDRLWTAMDTLLDAAELTPADSALERSIDAAIRQVARAIIPAKEAALLEQLAADRGAGAEAA